MPGHHHLQAPENRKEDYGLIDGVRPGYPETYGYLSEFRCVVSFEGKIYQRISGGYKICSSCFYKVLEEHQREYAMVPSFNLIHRTSAENQSNCTQCYKIIIKIRPAVECRGCIEEYLTTDEAYLYEGWGAPVFARWEEIQ